MKKKKRERLERVDLSKFDEEDEDMTVLDPDRPYKLIVPLSVYELFALKSVREEYVSLLARLKGLDGEARDRAVRHLVLGRVTKTDSYQAVVRDMIGAGTAKFKKEFEAIEKESDEILEENVRLRKTCTGLADELLESREACLMLALRLHEAGLHVMKPEDREKALEVRKQRAIDAKG